MAKQIPIEEIWPTPALIRAARGLLGIGQEELADKVKCARKTVVMIEGHTEDTMDARREAVVKVLAKYLEGQGVEFLPPDGKSGPAVRFSERDRETKVVQHLRKVIAERKRIRDRKAEEEDKKKQTKRKR